MQINVQIDNQVVVLKLVGNMVANAVEEFKSQVTKLLEKGYDKFIVELSQVEFMDSSGLGACMSVNRQVSGKNGMLVCSGLQGSVVKLFQITRADQKVPVSANQLEAHNLIMDRVIQKG